MTSITDFAAGDQVLIISQHGGWGRFSTPVRRLVTIAKVTKTQVVISDVWRFALRNGKFLQTGRDSYRADYLLRPDAPEVAVWDEKDKAQEAQNAAKLAVREFLNDTGDLTRARNAITALTAYEVVASGLEE